jgi:flagellar basal-body rod protein FlgC
MASEIYQISLNGLATERARMDAATSNIANANSVSSTPGAVYQVKTVISQQGFANVLNQQAFEIIEQNKVKQLYQPDHPLADIQGMVYQPDVNMVSEMLQLNMATRAYEANVRAFNASKEMNAKAMEIGK